MPYRKLEERIAALEKANRILSERVAGLEQSRDEVADLLMTIGGEMQAASNDFLTRELGVKFYGIGARFKSAGRTKRGK